MDVLRFLFHFFEAGPRESQLFHGTKGTRVKPEQPKSAYRPNIEHRDSIAEARKRNYNYRHSVRRFNHNSIKILKKKTIVARRLSTFDGNPSSIDQNNKYLRQ